MRPRVRAAITLLFAVAFLATAPVVLLMTSGYRYDPKRHRIRKTGIIHVDATPSGAVARLDGAAEGKDVPATFGRLLPQEYRVQVTKDGYLPWEKTLEVRSGETTFAADVVLYKDAVARLVAPADVGAAAWSPDGTDVAYVARTGDVAELLLSQDGEEPQLLSRASVAAYASPSLAWSPSGAAVLFSVRGQDGANRVTRFAADGPSTLAIHDAFPKGVLFARWSDDGDRMAAVTADGAFSVDEYGMVEPVLLGKGVMDVALRGRNAYVLRERQAAGGRTDVVLETAEGVEVTPVPFLSGPHRFLGAGGRRLLVLDERRGRLHVVDASTGELRTVSATGAAWSADGRRLLAWNDFEISIVDEDGSATLVTRLGEAITTCVWSPSGNAVLVGSADGITLVEFDARDRRVTHDLIRFSTVGAFAADASANMLRLIGTAGNRSGIYERDL